MVMQWYRGVSGERLSSHLAKRGTPVGDFGSSDLKTRAVFYGGISVGQPSPQIGITPLAVQDHRIEESVPKHRWCGADHLDSGRCIDQSCQIRSQNRKDQRG